MEIYHWKNYENEANFITHDNHLIKSSRVITLDKLTSTKIYSILILKVQNKPSPNIYFAYLFNDNDWLGSNLHATLPA